MRSSEHGRRRQTPGGAYRDPAYQYVLPAPSWLKGEASTALEPLAYIAPSFLHTAAFSIVTAAWLHDSPRVWRVSCAFWFTVNAVFELLQGRHGSDPSTSANPWLSWAMRYVTHGAFDPLDLVAAALGGRWSLTNRSNGAHVSVMKADKGIPEAAAHPARVEPTVLRRSGSWPPWPSAERAIVHSKCTIARYRVRSFIG